MATAHGAVDIVQNGSEEVPPGSLEAGMASVQRREKSSGTLPTALSCDAVKKPQWGSQTEFILTLIGYAVGLGNIWRFPYLVFTNGGAAFLIPYLIITVCLGVPIFALEVGAGQLFQKGVARVWRDLSVWTSGAGLASTLVCFIIGLYYNVLITYSLYYLGVSFRETVPWTEQRDENDNVLMNADIYLRENVLNVSESANAIGAVQWQLLIPFAAAWILIFAILFKGVESFGKVVYFTATFPYLILTALLIRAVTLEGAWLGLRYYLVPEWGRLLNPWVWVAAGQQVFFSLAVGWGTYTTFGALNPRDYNFFKDAWIVPAVNASTSFLAGCAVFGVLGFLSLQQQTDVADLDLEGVRLAFVAYPTAIANMPISPLWSILFFVMLATLGAGSQFGLTETVVDTLIELGFVWKGKRWVTVAGVCFLSFCLGLVYITRAGMFYLDLTDYFAFSICLFFILLVEVFGITLLYGSRRFVRELNDAVGRRLPCFFPFMWCSLVPVLLVALSGAALWQISVGDFSELVCMDHEDETCKSETAWIRPVGFIVAFIVVTPLVIAPIVELYKGRGVKGAKVGGKNEEEAVVGPSVSGEEDEEGDLSTLRAGQTEVDASKARRPSAGGGSGCPTEAAVPVGAAEPEAEAEVMGAPSGAAGVLGDLSEEAEDEKEKEKGQESEEKTESIPVGGEEPSSSSRQSPAAVAGAEERKVEEADEEGEMDLDLLESGLVPPFEVPLRGEGIAGSPAAAGEMIMEETAEEEDESLALEPKALSVSSSRK